MQIKTFIVPTIDSYASLDELNLFLRSHRILEIKKDLIRTEDRAYWVFCVTYLSDTQNSTIKSIVKGKTDYKNLLSEEEFSKFVKLRKIRKGLADKDAVPAFAVFTDAELAEISKMQNITSVALSKVDGIGEKRVEKYGKLLCDEFVNSIGFEKGEDETQGEYF